jgi:hypothetical protein
VSTALPNTPELVVPDDGADDNLWGLMLIALFSAWDRHFSGVAHGDVSAGDWTLDETEAQNGRLIVGGTISVGRAVNIPPCNRTYLVSNYTALSGDAYVVLKCGSGSYVYLPTGCSMMITVLGDTQNVIAASPPVDTLTGGFPDLVKQPFQSFLGPGMHFSGDTNTGFGRTAPGRIGAFLSGGSQAPDIVLQSDLANTQGLVFRSAGAYLEALLVTAGAMAFYTGNVQRMTISDGGLSVGAANGPVGEGKVNASQYYRSGNAMPFQYPFYINGLQVNANAQGQYAHGVGGTPVFVFGKLFCIAPDNGYSAGDIVTVDGSSGNPAIVIGGNANTVFYRVNDAYKLPAKTGTGGAVAINSAAWRLSLIAVWP